MEFGTIAEFGFTIFWLEQGMLTCSSLEQSVKDDVALLRDSPLIRREMNVRGYIYDIKSGKLEEVAVSKWQIEYI
jgi:carbonic anhydrase